MIKTASVHRFSSTKTIKISQELDALLHIIVREMNSKDF
ncbi:aspartyl-phosphate phosphatase Spo0E family protein [Metabacillus litoralis]